MMKGALKSKTVWFNVLLAVLGGLELMGAHLTTLWGPQVAAAIMLSGAMANLALRAVTTESLREKASG
ncbi:MAG: hypothetical protein IOD05_08270 [Rhodobacter sp.]|jgi:hypothetical protein|nr:hypothetical protein [Rhodobacter sp.]